MALAGEELRFVDPRTFGEVVVFDPDPGRHRGAGAGRLRAGPDGRRPRPRQAAALLAHPPTAAQAVLCSTSTWSPASATSTPTRSCTAATHPLRTALAQRPEVTRLHRCDPRRAGGGGRRRRLHARRHPVRRPDGSGGCYQDDHRVYGRAGERCRPAARASSCGSRSAGGRPTSAPVPADAPWGSRGPAPSGRVARAVFLKALTLKGFKSFADRPRSNSSRG